MKLKELYNIIKEQQTLEGLFDGYTSYSKIFQNLDLIEEFDPYYEENHRGGYEEYVIPFDVFQQVFPDATPDKVNDLFNDISDYEGNAATDGNIITITRNMFSM